MVYLTASLEVLILEKLGMSCPEINTRQTEMSGWGVKWGESFFNV